MTAIFADTQPAVPASTFTLQVAKTPAGVEIVSSFSPIADYFATCLIGHFRNVDLQRFLKINVNLIYSSEQNKQNP